MIYLDANATSRLRPEVNRIVTELLKEDGPRNASSVHQLGRDARSKLTAARKSILRLLHGASNGAKVVFTSGGTEACNSLIFGFLGPLPLLAKTPAHILTSAIEHPAVLEPFRLLEESGWQVSRVSAEEDGAVAVDTFISALRADTALVALMAANNETGSLQPICEVAARLRAEGYQGPIISDFTQVLGKSSLSLSDVFRAGVNGVAVSGHKIGAPAGIGAFVLNEAPGAVCFSFEPLLRGGAQEQNLRAGTENILGAVAWGQIADSLVAVLSEHLKKQELLRELLWTSLSEKLENIRRITPRNTEFQRSLCNTLSVQFSGCRGDDLVVALDLEGVCVSTGSACASGKQGISHVLEAMGMSRESAREVLRISLDWDAEQELLEEASIRIARVVERMRGLSVSRAAALEEPPDGYPARRD